MKIKFQDHVQQSPANFYKFELVDSIMKTHFKKLMKISHSYDWKTKTGVISSQNAYEFQDLVSKIEKSDPKRAKASHKKTIADKKSGNKTSSRSSTACTHDDLGSLGYNHGETVRCPGCGKMVEAW